MTARRRLVVRTPDVGVLTGTVDLALPPQDVWDYVTDWERQGEWIPATTVRIDGDRIVARTGFGPFGFDDIMHVVRSDAPRVCEVEHVGRVVSGTGLMTCLPGEDGGTVFSWEERVAMPGGSVAGVLWWVVAPALRFSYGIALRRLRRNLEPSPPAG